MKWMIIKKSHTRCLAVGWLGGALRSFTVQACPHNDHSTPKTASG
jgi:hypothetical protein